MTETSEHGVNVPLLRKTLEHITAHPEEWDQGAWAVQRGCGTALCVAGRVVVDAGHELRWDDGQDEGDQADRTVEGHDIPVLAAGYLGIPYRDGDAMSFTGHLFSAGNGLRDLWRIASDLTEGEIEVPADLASEQ